MWVFALADKNFFYFFCSSILKVAYPHLICEWIHHRNPMVTPAAAFSSSSSYSGLKGNLLTNVPEGALLLESFKFALNAWALGRLIPIAWFRPVA